MILCIELLLQIFTTALKVLIRVLLLDYSIFLFLKGYSEKHVLDLLRYFIYLYRVIASLAFL